MFTPLTKVLIKIFAYGFFKEHAGLLLSLFVSLIIYFFFIQVLNQTHLQPDEIILYNLSLVLEFVSNPIMMSVIFSLWLFYTVKSWKYVAKQLTAQEHQFLLYSSTSLQRVQQFKSWFTLQLIILLPLIVLGLFAFLVGITFDYYIIPAIIPLYLFLLTSLSAYIYLKLVNRITAKEATHELLILVRKWPKPLFSLFLYHIADTLKFAFSLTKLLSWLLITSIYFIFPDEQLDLRIAALFNLGVITAHAVLIYHSHEFDQIYLSFARNFPYSRLNRYLQIAVSYLLLLLPESIWFVIKFGPRIGVGLVLYNLAAALFFRSILYWHNLRMNKYLQVVFAVFMISLFGILYGFLWTLIPVIIILSIIIFFKNYYFLPY